MSKLKIVKPTDQLLIEALAAAVLLLRTQWPECDTPPERVGKYLDIDTTDYAVHWAALEEPERQHLISGLHARLHALAHGDAGEFGPEHYRHRFPWESLYPWED